MQNPFDLNKIVIDVINKSVTEKEREKAKNNVTHQEYKQIDMRVKAQERNSLAGQPIYTMYVVTVAAIHAVRLL